MHIRLLHMYCGPDAYIDCLLVDVCDHSTETYSFWTSFTTCRLLYYHRDACFCMWFAICLHWFKQQKASSANGAWAFVIMWKPWRRWRKLERNSHRAVAYCQRSRIPMTRIHCATCVFLALSTYIYIYIYMDTFYIRMHSNVMCSNTPGTVYYFWSQSLWSGEYFSSWHVWSVRICLNWRFWKNSLFAELPALDVYTMVRNCISGSVHDFLNWTRSIYQTNHE